MAAILVAKNKRIFLLVKMPQKMSYALTTNMVAFSRYETWLQTKTEFSSTRVNVS